MNGFQPFWGLTVLPPVVFLAKWGSYVSKKMLEILSLIPWHPGCLMTGFPFHSTQSISVLLWFPVLKRRIVVDIFYESISRPIFYFRLYLFPRLRNAWICIALVFLSFRPMQRVSEIQLIFESLPTWWKNKMPSFGGLVQLLNQCHWKCGIFESATSETQEGWSVYMMYFGIIWWFPVPASNQRGRMKINI